MALLGLFVLCFPAAVCKADSVAIDLEYRSDSLTWELFALVIPNGGGNSGQHGLAAVRALIDNVDHGSVTIATGIGALDPLDPGGINERPAVLPTQGGTLDIIYGQDLSSPEAVVGGVGVGVRTLLATGTYNFEAPPMFGDDDFGRITDGNFLDVAAPGPFGDALPWDSVALNVLDVTPGGLSGDFNGNGRVDIADYTVWRDNLGALDESVLMGNGNGQNGVEQEDYDLWKSNYGAVAASQTPSRAKAIPEPLTAMLVGEICVLLFACRSRGVSRSCPHH